MRYTTANKQLSDKLECWINIRCDSSNSESAGETNLSLVVRKGTCSSKHWAEK